MSNLEEVVVLPWHDFRRNDGIIPTLCTSSSLWLFAMGRELIAAQLAALFGHTSDSKFGGLTEKGVIGLLGNSMHLAEARVLLQSSLGIATAAPLPQVGTLVASAVFIKGRLL